MKGPYTYTQNLATIIVLLYISFSILWIVGSAKLLSDSVGCIANCFKLHLIVEFSFLAITSILLYALVSWGWRSLQTKHRLLQAVIEGSTDAIFVKDLQGRYLTINSVAAQILGKSPLEILGKDDAELLTAEFASPLIETDRQVMRTGQMRSLEEVIGMQGQRRTYFSTKYAHRNSAGKIIGLIGIARDITDRKSALEELQETNEKLEAIVAASPLAIFVLDRQGCVKMWNPAAQRMFGWREGEVLDTPLPIVPPDRIEECQNLRSRVFTGESFTNLEVQKRRRNGSPIDVSLSTAPLYNLRGEIDRIMAVATDISDRKRLQLEREMLLDIQAQLIASLRQETEDLTALSIVTANSITTLNLEELLNVLLQRIVAVTRADTAVIFLKEDDRSLRVRACVGLHEKVSPSYTIPIGQGFVGIIAETLKPLYIENAQTDPRILPHSFVRSGGICTMLGVPLKRYDRLVGVLHIDWCSLHPYSTREVQLLEITAERCAMAILNAQLYEQTKHLKERLQLQFDRMPIGCILINPDGLILEWNPAAEKIFGFNKSEILGRECNLIYPEDDRATVQEIWERLVQGEMVIHSISENLTKNGSIILCEWQNTAIKTADGTFLGLLLMVQDISKQQQAQKQLRQYAYYHPLTGLPNRTLFLHRIKQLVQQEIIQEPPLFAVFYLDINRFQIVKYSLGHQVANQLLLAVSERLQSFQSDMNSVTISHLEADEFAVLVPGISGQEEAMEMAKHLQQRLAIPFDLDNCEIFATTSIGIVLSSIGYQEPEEFLQAADTAMHHAQALPKDGCAIFDSRMQEQAVRRLQLDAELRRALENREFRLHYQPIVSLTDRQIIGFEALVRWLHPQQGLLPPSSVIPLAEETGLIVNLGTWVLEEACHQIRAWQQQFPTLKPLSMSVNVSAVQLVQGGFIEQVDRVLKETGIDPSQLKIEITETALMENAQWVTNILEQIKQRGIRLSIDDFGIGYSSLSYLHSFPFDTLKIDRAFVSNISQDTKNIEIIRTIIMLAHSLEMELIAEGIETVEQLQKLLELKCYYGQGYLFYKPQDSETIENLLRNLCGES